MLQPPRSIAEEHEEIMKAISGYSQLHDKTGQAIRGLQVVLKPHFEKETLIVMPVLGSLPVLVTEERPKDLKEIAEAQGAIFQEYEGMFREHAEIRNLISQAKKLSIQEKHRDVADFLDSLEHHTRVEEEVLYPAALLAGTIAKCVLPPVAPEAIS